VQQHLTLWFLAVTYVDLGFFAKICNSTPIEIGEDKFWISYHFQSCQMLDRTAIIISALKTGIGVF
jgi:hypothetical protein